MFPFNQLTVFVFLQGGLGQSENVVSKDYPDLLTTHKLCNLYKVC